MSTVIICMRFSVPQFIDVEDKIIGPLTLKQGIYVVGAVGITAGMFVQFGLFIALLFGAPILVLAFLLAFVKIHGRPFVGVLYAATFYAVKNKLYLWKKGERKKGVTEESVDMEPSTTRPVAEGLSQSRLKELAWSLDTNNTFDTETGDTK